MRLTPTSKLDSFGNLFAAAGKSSSAEEFETQGNGMPTSMRALSPYDLLLRGHKTSMGAMVA